MQAKVVDQKAMCRLVVERAYCMTSRRQFMASLACWVPISALAQPPALAMPQGTVILEVDGAIHRQSAGTTAQLDLAMLDALPQISFSTTTIWTQGIASFSGPPLLSVLDWLEADPGKITASAANEYSITLSPDTVDQAFPILATRKDGVPFSLRDSGPIWLIYPFDSDEKYSNDLIYSQSVWQLTGLHVNAT
jgi:hypothetical protein